MLLFRNYWLENNFSGAIQGEIGYYKEKGRNPLLAVSVWFFLIGSTLAIPRPMIPFNMFRHLFIGKITKNQNRNPSGPKIATNAINDATLCQVKSLMLISSYRVSIDRTYDAADDCSKHFSIITRRIVEKLYMQKTGILLILRESNSL